MKNSSVYPCLSHLFTCLAPATVSTEVEDNLLLTGHQAPNLSCADHLTACLPKCTKIKKRKQKLPSE